MIPVAGGVAGSGLELGGTLLASVLRLRQHESSARRQALHCIATTPRLPRRDLDYHTIHPAQNWINQQSHFLSYCIQFVVRTSQSIGHRVEDLQSLTSKRASLHSVPGGLYSTERCRTRTP